MSASLLPSLAGFTPLQILYNSNSIHYIYVRAHVSSKKGKAKDIGLPDGRTLFLVNIPPDATEREITHLFKSCGTIEKVMFAGDDGGEEEALLADEEEEEEGDDELKDVEEDQPDLHPRKKRKTGKTQQTAVPQVIPLPARTTRVLRRSGRSAHVVFLDESSLARALVSLSKARTWTQDASAPSGLDHYLVQHRSHRPPLDVVKAHANSWMEHFDWEQAKKKQQSKYKKGEAIVDSDGFTLVTRGGAYGQTLGGGVGVASKRFQRGAPDGGKRSRKNKNESKEKDAFYAFQIHERKRKELMDLKQKWEEDKAKVEKLKESRKFKPY
ncbi:ribosomal RNA-processing protein 7-domain-containing protein [Cytidiella melzeri]|nr:ribosomal RNA-processing protein 7-domain-containing protein [Cytidiella melzeri]